MPDVAAIADAMRGHRTLVVTGAGISTTAGVPDYRGTPDRRSVEYEDFVLHEIWYRYLWWRNEMSWTLLRQVAPTAGHRALARLEEAGPVIGIATQNVDGLHTLAGSRQVAELHGTFDAVVCLHCGARFTRSRMSEMIRDLNPGLDFPAPPLAELEIIAAKDEESAQLNPIEVPPCPHCDGMLKPDVVLFGEPLPKAPVRAASALAGACDVVLTVGTSLDVSTGMWVVMQAMESGARLVVVNRGPSQADRLADLVVDGGADDVLSGLADVLLGDAP